ncbi:membrane protein insertion efficiency factor YidD [Helicobacter ailurogastricus]|uniref:Putative membrane protein insertion efficiency factor n=1 Tax=Helicobacter ailurogastricus TaxID=1578720 RepID=A0A0K2Y2G6_9HELI|nr:membrane protein insertion efficiency factor YidD [Helicobacter ailurogastricus]BDQ29664.1 putative membrane protein insertion efficiency factor [Helicobacter ailurogastricus]GMB91405.1 Putative membrane protein insertion efficiency factor YidD [Helicobacter ailurogastricus]CRF52527.1 Protein YidD [Helicobacter ailurogastricus]
MNFALALLRFYRAYLSPLKPATCRFYPSCSTYALWLLPRESLPKALLKIARRLLSCHPFHPGGIDYPTTSKPLCPKHAAPSAFKLSYYLVPLSPNSKTYYILKVRP